MIRCMDLYSVPLPPIQAFCHWYQELQTANGVKKLITLVCDVGAESSSKESTIIELNISHKLLCCMDTPLFRVRQSDRVPPILVTTCYRLVRKARRDPVQEDRMDF
ncbi:uncharacterized protein [Porites lutea]|uniref:uncharacterized protein n=1 Tax=Porites lutea TaxID=51062 RepID=UPI003CC6A189